MATDEITLRNPGSVGGVVITNDGSVATIKDEISDAVLLEASALREATGIADMTEGSGAIGGTNNGDIPDMTVPSAANNAAGIREVANHVNEILNQLRSAGVLAEE